MPDARVQTPLAELASIAWWSYYRTELTGADRIAEYLEDIYNDPDNSQFDNLSEAIYDDIRDLLHNSNLEDLFPFANELNDDDYEALALRLHDGWRHDPDPLIELSDALAKTALATINTREN